MKIDMYGFGMLQSLVVACIATHYNVALGVHGGVNYRQL
jgi:hypothetical protein